MKLPFFISVLLFAGCNDNGKNTAPVKTDTQQPSPAKKQEAATQPEVEKQTPKIFSNKRFRNVSVEKIGANKFRIKGQGQIFEANFNWSIEDGHEELQKGFQMTDAGAPEWGKFDFTINVQKKRENSTLTLVLFESSAKDGSRQHELPIILE